MSPRTLEVIVLAAGLGTRMKSDLPKVLHKVCETPMLSLLLEQLDAALRSKENPFSVTRLNVVVGHGKEQVVQTVEALRRSRKIGAAVTFTFQEQQLGTGHAVKLALEQPSPVGSKPSEEVAVFNGDLPLFTRQAFLEFARAHAECKSAASLASAVLDDPGQYGRVLRKGKAFLGVVEAKDATAAQKKVHEVNGGVYIFQRKLLESSLKKLKTANASKEFYLPDVFSEARKAKMRVLAHLFSNADLLRGANNMRELAEAQKILYRENAERAMTEGVFLSEPGHTYIGPAVRFGRGCSVGPLTAIHGDSVLGNDVKIGVCCELRDVRVADGCEIRNHTVAESAVIGTHSKVGPMAHLRPGTKLGEHVKVGNFVEIKEASLGNHTSAAHLSYIGDASVGSDVNIGCGFVTCNYDGRIRNGQRKHRTEIGDRVFIGSDSQVVAPISIADGTFIASGSTVTESVNVPDSLVLARTRQVTKPGYAKKYKKK